MRASVLGIVANVFLLGIKATASGLSDSLTIYSETLNSLSDVIASTAILLCVHWAAQSADASHPYGHKRAEPIAALLVSIFTGILGFEVVRTAFVHFWAGKVPDRIGPYPSIALCITGILKAWLAVYFIRRSRELNSPALGATAVDCRNDVLIAIQGLVAVMVAQMKIPILDSVAALIVGGYIFYSAIRLGMENIDYLMGKSPGEDLIRKIRASAETIAGVEAVEDIKGHYVGTFIHLELTARVNGTVSTLTSHEISEAIRTAVESIPPVDRAFVHIEPTVARKSAEKP